METVGDPRIPDFTQSLHEQTDPLIELSFRLLLIMIYSSVAQFKTRSSPLLTTLRNFLCSNTIGEEGIAEETSHFRVLSVWITFYV